MYGKIPTYQFVATTWQKLITHSFTWFLFYHSLHWHEREINDRKMSKEAEKLFEITSLPIALNERGEFPEPI